MTTVVNTKTGDEHVYPLEPEDAVRVAYLEHAFNNYNTMEFTKYESIKPIEGKYTIIFGDFLVTKQMVNNDD